VESLRPHTFDGMQNLFEGIHSTALERHAAWGIHECPGK